MLTRTPPSLIHLQKPINNDTALKHLLNPDCGICMKQLNLMNVNDFRTEFIHLKK